MAEAYGSDSHMKYKSSFQEERTKTSSKNSLSIPNLLFKKEDELNKTKATLDGIREERDQLRRKVHNLMQEIDVLKHKQPLFNSAQFLEQSPTPTTIAFSRKAERIKLRKTEANKPDSETTSKNIHGKDVSESDSLSSAVVEQLVQTLRDSSSIQEILHSCQSPNNMINEQVLRQEFQLQMEKANCRYEHMKSENNVLLLTLQESKSKTEQLQLLLSKYESNNTALEIAFFYSELIVEAYDSLISMMEESFTKKSLIEGMLRNCRQDCHSKIIKIIEYLNYLIESDFTVNQVPLSVSHFLMDWENRQYPQFDLMPSDVKNLLIHMKKVKRKKEAVKQTIMDLSSFSIELLHSPSLPRSPGINMQSDLENAVLLHELTSVKKELAELKCQQNFTDSKTKNQTTNKISDDEDMEDCAYAVSETGNNKDDKSGRHPIIVSLADLRIGTMAESEIGAELSQALKREQKLKSEIERLSFTLQQVQINSEKRHNISKDVLSKVKTSYSLLQTNAEKERKRNADEIRQLNEKIVKLNHSHQQEIQRLRQQVLILEREKENARLPDNETAI